MNLRLDILDYDTTHDGVLKCGENEHDLNSGHTALSNYSGDFRIEFPPIDVSRFIGDEFFRCHVAGLFWHLIPLLVKALNR